MEEQNNEPIRKYVWVDKWAKLTGDRARVNHTYIVYWKNGKLVKEFPNRDIITFKKESDS